MKGGAPRDATGSLLKIVTDLHNDTRSGLCKLAGALGGAVSRFATPTNNQSLDSSLATSTLGSLVGGLRNQSLDDLLDSSETCRMHFSVNL